MFDLFNSICNLSSTQNVERVENPNTVKHISTLTKMATGQQALNRCFITQKPGSSTYTMLNGGGITLFL